MSKKTLSGRSATALAIGIGLALAGLIVLFVTHRVYATKFVEAQASAAERRSMQARLDQVRREKSAITGTLEEYKRLLQRGVIGPEKRLDWIDALVIVREENKLPELKYSIDPQKYLEYPGVPSSTEAPTMTSPMKLEMALVHEGDLFRVLAGLRRLLPAYFVVEDCEMVRMNQSGDSARGTAARLQANCKTNVITIRDRPVGTTR